MRETGAGPLVRELAAQLGTSADELPTALARVLATPEASLPVPPMSDRTTWLTAQAPELLRHARADLGTAWPQPLAHDAARVHVDGDRSTWEQTAFARVQRSSRSVIAAALTGERSWLPEVLDGVVLLCEQSSWCWPAHDEAHSRRGWMLADVTAPVVDLGASEIAAHLAWLDHVAGAELEGAYPGVRERMRHDVRTRVLEPFINRDDWWWMGDERPTINWTPWILGNVLAAALRLLDGPAETELRVRIIARVVVGLDRYIDDMPADGAIDEGYHYWWAGAARLLEALDLIEHATGGALDPFANNPKLRATVAFPHSMQLGSTWFVSVADARAYTTAPQPWHALRRAARHLGDGDAEEFARSHRTILDADETMNLGRLLLALVDAHPHDRSAPYPAEVWLPSTQMLVARETAGAPDGLAVVAKGGHNDESHNHNDVGSVIVASDGVPIIVDAGRPTYTAQTFSEDRYDLWMMQSDWHSVPVIAGHAQKPGREYAARDLVVETGSLALDLAAAYGLGDRATWRREVRLDRAARSVVVHDAWEWRDDKRAEGAHEVRFLLAGDVTLVPGHAHVVPLGSAAPVDVTWNGSAPAMLATKLLDDPMLSDVWGEKLTRLDIDVSALSELTVTIRQDCSEGGR